MIPKSFKLANRTWRVRYVAGMTRPDGLPVWGHADGDTATITLSAEMREPGKEELLAHTWEHELLHALMMAHGCIDHDERFVDGVAGLRRQYELTKRLPAASKEVIQKAGKPAGSRRKKKAPRGRRR